MLPALRVFSDSDTQLAMAQALLGSAERDVVNDDVVQDRPGTLSGSWNCDFASFFQVGSQAHCVIERRPTSAHSGAPWGLQVHLRLWATD